MKEVICSYCKKPKILKNKDYKNRIKKGCKRSFHAECFKKYRAKLGFGSGIISCEFCGKKQKRKNCRIKKNKIQFRNKHDFCSKLCYGQYRSLHPEEYPRPKPPPPKIYIVICPICKEGRELSRKAYYRKKTDYCAECWLKYMHQKTKKIRLKCTGCRKEFYRKKYRVLPSKVHYCGDPCGSKRVTVKCSECGKEKKMTPAKVRRCKHYFCDMGCYRKYISTFKNCPRTKFPSQEIARKSQNYFNADFETFKALNLLPIIEIYDEFKKFKKEVYKK